MGASPAQHKRLAKIGESEDTSRAQFADRFYREVQAKERKDCKMPLRYLEKDILPFIGLKRVRGITTDDVRTV